MVLSKDNFGVLQDVGVIFEGDETLQFERANVTFEFDLNFKTDKVSTIKISITALKNESGDYFRIGEGGKRPESRYLTVDDIVHNFTSLDKNKVLGADLADKIFTLDNSPILKSTNGYQKLPSGLIKQWGVLIPSTTGINVYDEFTFPISFSSTPIITCSVNPTKGVGTFCAWSEKPNTLNYYSSNASTINWIAVGY